ncbi:F-box only protein 7 isoform X3 [Phycodurus eques]|uniref:F-box only protein 7 isoform X3 n=1 Tax=Phycodurus eques TaxID=693459 RepID=UPI002ACEB381|nr:F-box only protein 7 isoform X3 [Phycodurus eques]
MKLRVRLCKQTSKVDVVGPESTLGELMAHIRDVLLPGRGLSPDVTFALSLNGTELLADTGQKLSSCGVVPGDLIRVLLPAGAGDNDNDDDHASPGDAARPRAGPSAAAAPPGDAAGRLLVEPATGAVTSGPPCCATPPDASEHRTPPTLSWEPMLCGEAGEGQAPHSLELLYRAARVTCPTDVVMVAAHLLMLETGFTPQGAEVKPAEMPSGWRSSGGAYRLQYTHTLCERGVVTVVAVPMSPVLVIEAILQVADSASMAAKVCVDPSSYVTEAWPGQSVRSVRSSFTRVAAFLLTDCRCLPGASAASAFTSLSRLSRVFKDQLVYPLIAATREALCLPVAFGLSALPPELILLVLRLLDVVSVVRLSAVCRHLNGAAADATLWRHLVRRDFSDHKWQGETNWKELYKSFYKFRHKRGCVNRPCSLPPFIHRPVFSPVPAPYPPIPGIIGGGYDHRPAALPHGAPPTPRYDPVGPPLHGERRRRSDPRPPAGGARPGDIRRGFV